MQEKITLEEINRYYEFPMKMNDKCYYILANNGRQAFNIIVEDRKYMENLVDLMNGKEIEANLGKFKTKYPYIVSCDKNKNVLMVRGWGWLIGQNACHLSSEKAHRIQVAFLKHCCKLLNGEKGVE